MSKKMIPEVRFEGFEGKWKILKIKNIGQVITGNTPTTMDKSNYAKDGLLWVTPTDINKNITNQSARKLSKQALTKARIVPKGSILVTCIASIGKNTLVNEMSGFNQQINAVIPNKEFDSYFLLTLSIIWSNQMKRSAALGTMQIVNRAQFLAIDTIAPSHEEQIAIGNFFKTLDNKIELENQNIDKLKQFKKAMLQKMFV